MDPLSPFHIVAIVSGTVVLAALGRAIRAAVGNRRKERHLAEAKKLARSMVDSITRAIFSKNPAELQSIAENVACIYRLADIHGFPLHEIRASKQRLDRWMFLAEEILHHGGKVPAWRRLASLVNAPANVIDRNEPGTPDIGVNGQLALPMTSTTTTEELRMDRSDEPRIIVPPVEPHPIDAMIQEVMDMDLPPGPAPKLVETVTIHEDGTTTTALEPEEDGYISIEFEVGEEGVEEETDLVAEADIIGEEVAPEPSPEATLSIDEQVERMFDKIVLPD